MANAGKRLCGGISLHLNNGNADAARFEKLRGVLQAHRGSSPFVIEFQDENGKPVKIRVGRELYANYTDDFRRAVLAVFGDAELKLAGMPPELAPDKRNNFRRNNNGNGPH
jgi:hypothetical protein